MDESITHFFHCFAKSTIATYQAKKVDPAIESVNLT